jgi:hypothetical protein
MSARCPVCPKADTTGRFMSTRPSLTPLADLGRFTPASSTAPPARRRRCCGSSPRRDRRAPVPARASQRAPFPPHPRRSSPAWGHVRVAPEGIAARAGGARSTLPASMFHARPCGRPCARRPEPRVPMRSDWVPGDGLTTWFAETTQPAGPRLGLRLTAQLYDPVSSGGGLVVSRQSVGRRSLAF